MSYDDNWSRIFLVLWADGSESWESEQDCDRCIYSIMEYLDSVDQSTIKKEASLSGQPESSPEIAIIGAEVKDEPQQIDVKPTIEFINIDDWSDFED